MHSVSKSIEFLEKASQLSEKNGDWITYIRSNILLAKAIVSNVNKDATNNGLLAWDIILKAKNKAEEIGEEELLKQACFNALLVASVSFENIDSNKVKIKQAIDFGKYVLENSTDFEYRLRILHNLIITERAKLPNQTNFLQWFKLLTNILKKNGLSNLKTLQITLFIGHFLDAYAITNNKKILEDCETYIAYIGDRRMDDINKDVASSWTFYKYRSQLEEYKGNNAFSIKFLEMAYESICRNSPIDAANILHDLAVKANEGNNFSLAMSYLNKADKLIDEIWLASYKKAIFSNEHFIKTDLFFLSSYFKLTYEFAANICIENNNFYESLAWREKGLYNFYKTVLSDYNEESAKNILEINDSISEIINNHPEILFLHFNITGPKNSCTACTKNQHIQTIDLDPDLYNKIINLAGTDYENSSGFWDYYFSWQHTQSTGSFDRWLIVLDLVSRIIGDLVFMPVLKEINCEQINKIVLVVNGWKNGIPFQIAKVNSNEFIINKFTVVQLPSLLLAKLLKTNNAKSVSILDGQHADLQWAKAEVDAIEDLLIQAKISNHKITGHFNSVYALANSFKENPDHIVHIATHMQYIQDKSSDTAIIFNLNGEEFRLMITDLLANQTLGIFPGTTIVLSGCESNMVNFNKPGDHISLAKAFILSGAKNVVGSSWAVDDMASFFLMRQLYIYIITEKQSDMAEALKLAQQWLSVQTVESLLQTLISNELKQSLLEMYPDLKNIPFEHPYFWGAWSFIGSIN